MTAQTDVTVEEMTQSLNGFDEIAIEKQFKINPYMDGEREPMKLARALVFVHRRREGDADPAAYEYAMNLPLKDAMAYFADDREAETDDPDQPESPAGKDGSQPE